MKSRILVLALVLAAFGCATEEKPASAPSQAACKPAPSELLTQDMQPGTGDTVRFRSAILVEYTGWLYDGCARDLHGKQSTPRRAAARRSASSSAPAA